MTKCIWKRKGYHRTVFCREKRRLHGNDIPECGMVSAGIEWRKIRYVYSGYPDAWRKRNRGSEEIRRLYPDPVIIFITNFVDYAIEAYEVNTYRYIPKECLKEKLPQAYDALLPGIMEKEERYYIINKRNEVEKLAYSDIFYMKKKENMSFLCTGVGK